MNGKTIPQSLAIFLRMRPLVATASHFFQAKEVGKKQHTHKKTREPSRAFSPLACGHPKRPVLDYPKFFFLSCPFSDQS